MPFADLPVLAALLLALAALPAGWRGGRALRWTMAGTALLFAANIMTAWHMGDPPNTTLEGQSAVAGLMIAVALPLCALAMASVGKIMRWSMTNPTSPPQGSGRPKETIG